MRIKSQLAEQRLSETRQGREDTSERRTLLAEQARLDSQIQQLQNELESYERGDPQTMQSQIRLASFAREKAIGHTENMAAVLAVRARLIDRCFVADSHPEHSMLALISE